MKTQKIVKFKELINEYAINSSKPNGRINWKDIKANHPQIWKQLHKLSGGSMPYMSLTASQLRKAGELNPQRETIIKVGTNGSNGHFKNGHVRKSLAGKLSQTAGGSATLHFCPQCAFPIGAVIKAVNALNAVRGGGN